jgi:hypothetical protein
VYAIGEYHREIELFGHTVPSFIPDDDGVRKTYGYLHSALGFYYLFLFGIWFVFGIYQAIRYRVGITRLMPGVKV